MLPAALEENDISVTKFLDRQLGQFLYDNDISVTKFLEDNGDNDISVTKFLYTDSWEGVLDQPHSNEQYF